jgi:hypothetical protein
VGHVRVGFSDHAAMWSGTAESWVDLHPSFADSSVAWDVHGGWQVGTAVVDLNDEIEEHHAILWRGTADSWEELPLPADFDGFLTGSDAYGVWSDATTLYIVGSAFSYPPERHAVLLWSRPLGCPADFNGDGDVNTEDVIAFLNAWNHGDPRTDSNGDGHIDSQDVIAFLNGWNAGC